MRASVTALAMVGCGRIGFEVLDIPMWSGDGGTSDEGDADVAQLDASLQGDGGGPHGEGGARRDAGDLDDSAAPDTQDARAMSAPDAASDAGACAAGYARCDADPSTCETQLGTVTNCARCGDACPSGDGTPQCRAGVCSTACDLSGTWAGKITIQVSWQATVIAAGSGTATIWFRFRGMQGGGGLPGTLLPCGMILPDFALQPALASERYQISVPNTLFDQQPSDIPGVSATLQAAAGFTTGSSFTLSDTAVLIGVSLANPFGAAWPSVEALTSVDMDRDSKPGVTVPYSNGGGYIYPRINFNGSQRMDLAYVAARLRLRATGTLPSCTAPSFMPTVVSLDTRVVGCRVAPAGADCSTAQRDLADMGTAVYMPGAASLSMVRIADDASCAQARSALP